MDTGVERRSHPGFTNTNVRYTISLCHFRTLISVSPRFHPLSQGFRRGNLFSCAHVEPPRSDFPSITTRYIGSRNLRVLDDNTFILRTDARVRPRIGSARMGPRETRLLGNPPPTSPNPFVRTSRSSLKSVDASGNPYLLLASIVAVAIEGVDNQMTLTASDSTALLGQNAKTVAVIPDELPHSLVPRGL